jgi:predicted aspartyl protease
MVFPAEVQGSKATAMLDSGASCNVISAEFAKALHLEIVPPEGDSVGIKLADGRTVNHIGCTVLDIVIQGVQFTKVSCLVLDFAMDWDVLLGTPWLKTFRASLMFEEDTVRGYTRKN